MAKALSRLEAEYERVMNVTGSVKQLQRSIPDSRQKKRSARRANKGSSESSEPNAKPRREDVGFVPTPQELVDVMLKVAKVTTNDIVYDLGCGDGRIVIAAAKSITQGESASTSIRNG